jgi:hypothetical protein
MATTTPNYGWDVPTSTDYVKDGATAIETLGDDIDASLFSVTGGKNVGLVHINTTTFSAASSFIVSNVFNSSYDRYRLIVDAKAASGQVALNYRNSLSGTPASGASTYAYSSFFTGSTGGSGVNFYSTGQSYATIGQITDQTGAVDTWHVDILNPGLAKYTAGSFLGTYGTTAASTFGGFYHTVATAYDGFQLSASSSTITGTVRVYGYRN